jgi:hypothetical protein
VIIRAKRKLISLTVRRLARKFRVSTDAILLRIKESSMKSAKRSVVTAVCALVTSLFGATSWAQTPNCQYVVSNEWNDGYTAIIRITNNQQTAIQGWQVSWQYQTNRVSNYWNAVISGSQLYTATGLGWNNNIQPGQSVEFGFQVTKNGGATEQPAVTGSVCSGGAASSVSSSSTAVSSISSSIQSSSSSAASSSVPPIVGGCSGYATRFWDCCKPHCGWSGNVPNGMEPMKSCSANNQVLSDLNAGSSCEGGNAHTCYGLSPYAVSNTLSYGYAATSSGDVCGRCYQLEFTGQSHNAPGDPGSAALAGKTMIVQAINVGYDVGGGQFDIMIPGGGVGAFNGCSNQWGVSNSELGAQYGGFLSACKNELGYNASGAQYKACVTNRCNNIFGSRGLTDLQAGCLWYANWFEAADNPALRYREVACPTQLASASGMNRTPLGDISNSCN